MSDVDVFRTMLEKSGLKYEEHRLDGQGWSFLIMGGYVGFYTTIDFKEDGSLEAIGAYE